MKIGDLVRRTNSINEETGVVVRVDVMVRGSYRYPWAMVAWNLERHCWDESLLADLEVISEIN